MQSKKIRILEKVLLAGMILSVAIILALPFLLKSILNAYYPNLNFNGPLVFGVCLAVLFVPYIYILFKVYSIIELVKTGEIFTEKTSSSFRKMSIASIVLAALFDVIIIILYLIYNLYLKMFTIVPVIAVSLLGFFFFLLFLIMAEVFSHAAQIKEENDETI